jgi:hypothetical protein
MSADVAIQLAAIQNVIKACGSIIHLEPEDFDKMLATLDSPLVVTAESGVFSTTYKYVTHYKGLTLYCKSKEELRLPAKAEVLRAKSIVVPDL